jgi:hypothetical protein
MNVTAWELQMVHYVRYRHQSLPNAIMRCPGLFIAGDMYARYEYILATGTVSIIPRQGQNYVNILWDHGPFLPDLSKLAVDNWNFGVPQAQAPVIPLPPGLFSFYFIFNSRS